MRTRPPRRTARSSPKLLHLVALGVAGLVLAACGGATPSMDPAVAEDLAARADALALRLDAGDACGAIETAGGLVSTAAARRDAGEVPEAVAGEVIDTARDTVRGLTCAPEPAPEPSPAPEDRGEDEDDEEGGRGKGKGKGRDKGDDD